MHDGSATFLRWKCARMPLLGSAEMSHLLDSPGSRQFTVHPQDMLSGTWLCFMLTSHGGA